MNFSDILDVIDSGVVVLDDQYQVRYWNLWMASHSKIPAEEIIGQSLFDFFPKIKNQRFLRNFKSVFAFGNFSFFTQKDPQPLFPMKAVGSFITEFDLMQQSCTMGPLREGGEIKYLFISVRDVSETVFLERRVSERTEIAEQRAIELARANEDLKQFTSIASHDLKEPLRKIITLGGILKEDYQAVLDEEGVGCITRMASAAGRMQNLIDDLLALSKITTKTFPFIPTPLDEVVHDVLDTIEESRLQAKGLVEVGPLPTIDADPTQMYQLFQNLIGNGLKYHRKEVPPVVRITALQGHNGAAHITVSDNGIGFDEKYFERILKPFQRLHNRSEFEGTGMGLAICDKIVHRHHGSLTAKSALGKGTTFNLTLPLHQPEKT
ncbi:MAG: ATP-binding protein [Nitrospiria bacterium]